MLRVELPGDRKRRMPERRYVDAVSKHMALVEVMEDDAEDRTKWRWKIRCSSP